VAARRAGARTIIFPRDNLSDWLELPEVSHPLITSQSAEANHILQNIKHEIEGVPVDWYGDVFNLVFKDLDRSKANALWKEQLKSKSTKDRSDADAEGDDVNPAV